MKSKFFFMAAVAALVLTSCEQDFEVIEVVNVSTVKEKVVFEATTDASLSTRTSLSSDVDENGNYYLSWNYGDEISINDGTSTAVFSTTSIGAKATFKSKTGSVSGSASTYTAFYPSSITPDNMVLPANQEYKMNGVNGFPMRAVSDSKSLSFKNLCGIIRFNLTAESGFSVAVKSISLSCDGKGLSGNFTVDSDGSVVVAGSDGVVMTCPSAVTLYQYSNSEFNLILPKGDYPSLKVKIISSDGKEVNLVSASPIKINRSGITQVTKTLKECDFNSSLETITFTDSDVEFTER